MRHILKSYAGPVKPLTKRQLQIAAWMDGFVAENGYRPTMNQVMAEFDIFHWESAKRQVDTIRQNRNVTA